jgi:hypothetical protein
MASRATQPGDEPLPRVQRESADSYGGVVVVLNESWRLSISKGRTEWLLQCRSETKLGKSRWMTRGRYTDPFLLRARIRELCGQIDDDADQVLASLGDWGGRRQ